MVAKSYTNWEMLEKPFISSNKSYVRVRNPKTGVIKPVRWYSEKEFNKIYNNTKFSKSQPKRFRSLKSVLGFDKGYITIFSRNDNKTYQEWFSQSIARWHCRWGWYIISEREIPNDIPNAIKQYKLYWDDICVDENTLKSEEETKRAVDKVRTEHSSSLPLGNVGDRLDLEVTITSSTKIQSRFPDSKIIYMIDNKKNIFKWFSSSATGHQLKVGDRIAIRATIKKHIEENGENVTVLTRCVRK